MMTGQLCECRHLANMRHKTTSTPGHLSRATTAYQEMMRCEECIDDGCDNNEDWRARAREQEIIDVINHKISWGALSMVAGIKDQMRSNDSHG